ncbi:MAG TPA: hypothetical protein VMU05_13570 [Dongiaceae bacterium]|nr:hypothetical protein [Dongiaceae bacterium]
MPKHPLPRSVPGNSEAVQDLSRREFLSAGAALLVGLGIPNTGVAGGGQHGSGGSGQRVVIVIFGGVRRAETFSPEGIANIPHLSGEMLHRALLFGDVRNEGVTAHFNAISSIFTGNWQRVDDWGKLAPTTPTFFEFFRRQLRVAQSDTWVIASNKALTSLIGASSASGYGPSYGANVVFPKQLMVAAVINALHAGRTGNLADRARVETELQAMLEAGNYEGLGWSVEGANHLDPRVRSTIEDAISNFVRSGGPTSGDELTYLVSKEVIRKFSPRLLVVILSDVEVAHFGSYALHVAGIRTADRLAYQLWQNIETDPEYNGRTTMFILPEFGRDPDGSATNGFFNHRSDTESTRSTWMMALGSGIEKPGLVERPVRHVDLCPTAAGLLGCPRIELQGVPIPEFRT